MTMILNKPVGSSWTDDQWKAISEQGHNILVAAAAGSGKTAVLVERIIKKIASLEQPMDVDRLLVATFTKAAAVEMRERIREALEHELVRQPESEHLKRQLALMNKASITTLHSFCLEVIHHYFHIIPLDPAFRIANETEAELLRLEVLEGYFEELYDEASVISVEETDAEAGANSDSNADDNADADERLNVEIPSTGETNRSAFWQLADAYGGERGDAALYKLVQQLYDFSRSHPWPEQWLREQAAAFRVDSIESLEQTTWYQAIVQDVRLELKGVIGLLQQALRLTELHSGPKPYAANLRDDMDTAHYLTEVADAHGWELLYHAFQGAGFGKLKACKGDDYDKGLQEQVKALRDQAKKQLYALKDELFQREPADYRVELETLAPQMEVLSEIVIEFGERYRKAKVDKGLVDFADLEHYCLHILRHSDSTPEQLLPSEAAEQYREQFLEVLLDEYQDTNRVQEAIIELISRPGAGNRFMVGDVKQSIYRFRLAEPGLFLEKYKAYTEDGTGTKANINVETDTDTDTDTDTNVGTGQRIDLARNFRSRQDIVDSVNYLFKQLMNEQVVEISYDQRAELVCGASYPVGAEVGFQNYSTEVLLYDRTPTTGMSEDGWEEAEDETHGQALDDDTDARDELTGEGSSALHDAKDMETARVEAELIITQIRRLLGQDGQETPFQVYDKRIKGLRSITYRDIVILLRATQSWAPMMIEQLRAAGIPAYADLNTGYFQATEVEVILSLLQIIDNPDQDIPLAGVLRSPIFQLTAEQLAQIRIEQRSGTFYDAVVHYALGGVQVNSVEQAVQVEVEVVKPTESVRFEDSEPRDEQLVVALRRFLERLEIWRNEARQGALADLIWKIFRETGYYELVGGMAGGVQRQANLRALYDRARQYEATSFRGLFRFLRFVERMQDNGGDLGAARALGEQEDVVRILSIHKSKGLEFPVVFVAGLSKQFNQQDLRSSFLMHKELGFGPKFVDPLLRLSYPTLPSLAIKRSMRMELLAEELRVLYVALTRPKEKLFLISTVRKLEKQVERWGQALDSEQWFLPDSMIAKAKSYLDWIGPALIRHPDAMELKRYGGLPLMNAPFTVDEPSRFQIQLIHEAFFTEGWGMSEAAATAEMKSDHDADQTELRFSAMKEGLPIEGVPMIEGSEIERRLSWVYSHKQAEKYHTKTSVTELKRLQYEQQAQDAAAQLLIGPAAEQETEAMRTLIRRPRFIQERKLTAAERGIAYHALMQHLPIRPNLSNEDIGLALQGMVAHQQLTEEQAKVIDIEVIASFVTSELGSRLGQSVKVHREVPFSYGLPALEVYADAVGTDAADETILIQGVIDCLFEEKGQLVLIDYKTDAIHNDDSLEEVASRYELQLSLYARAVSEIWGTPVTEKYLFFFDGAHIVKLD